MKFSEIIKDILLPTATASTASSCASSLSNELAHQKQLAQFEKLSLDTLEQANLVLLSNLQQKYCLFEKLFHK